MFISYTSSWWQVRLALRHAASVVQHSLWAGQHLYLGGHGQHAALPYTVRETKIDDIKTCASLSTSINRYYQTSRARPLCGISDCRGAAADSVRTCQGAVKVASLYSVGVMVSPAQD